MGEDIERIDAEDSATRPAPARRRWLWALTAVVLVLLAGAATWLLLPDAPRLDLSTRPARGLAQPVQADSERVRVRQEVADGVVTIHADGTVRRLDRDLREQWTTTVDAGPGAPLSVVDATADDGVVIAIGEPDATTPSEIVVGPESGLAMPAEPIMVWLDAADGQELARRTWSVSEVPVTSDDHRLYSFDRASGVLTSWESPEDARWTYQMTPFAPGNNEPALHRIGDALILDDGLTAQVNVRAIVDRATGEAVHWLGDGEHVAVNDALIRLEDHEIVGRNWTDGRELWRLPIGAEEVSAQGGELFLLFGSGDGPRGVRAIDARTGETRWTKPHALDGWIEVVGDRVFIMGTEEQWLVVDRDSGEGQTLSYAPAAGAETSGMPVIGEDAYLCVGLAGNALIVTSRSLDDGSELWTTHLPDAWMVDELAGWPWAAYDGVNHGYAPLR